MPRRLPLPPVERRPILHLPCGLPGSGKSTLARELAATGVAHVELDVIRRRVWPGCPPSWDPYSGEGLAVQAAFERTVLALLASGRDVVADRTNLDQRGVGRLRQLAPGVRLVVHDLTHVPLVVCIARDAGRPVGERVGEVGIRALWVRWLASDAASLAPSRAPGGPQGASGASSGARLDPSAPVAPQGLSGLSGRSSRLAEPDKQCNQGQTQLVSEEQDMTTRTFTREQLTAMGVPNDWDAEGGQRAEHLHEQQVDTRRWVSVHELVFRAPDDGLTYRVHYDRGLTEHQDGTDAWNYADEIKAVEVEQRPVVVQQWTPVDAPADRSLDSVLPAWEAMYEPGNVSDYLIGYANSEVAAKGAAEAWMRSQAEVTGRLEWVPQKPIGGYAREFELIEHHDDVDTGPGINVRRRNATPTP